MNRLAELVDQARKVIAEMGPEIENLSPPDNFAINIKLKSIQYNLSKIKEIADKKKSLTHRPGSV